MISPNYPTLGLALSGSGNRSTFYIGFLEVLNEAGIKPDYIAACSGGSVVAAAYACGTMTELKNFIFNAGKADIKKLMKRSEHGGGFYSLEILEEEMRRLITKGKTFEEVSPHLAFVAVDINTGQRLPLCIGDIAQAACISSTVPGLIEPYRWGSHTLVDGGILTIVPVEALKAWEPAITIGINLRATKHIFTQNQISFKKAFNLLKKMLFVDEIESWLTHLFPVEDEGENPPGLFSVWGKSLDLVIKISGQELKEEAPDLMIVPDFPRLKRSDVSRHAMVYHYEMGKKAAQEYLPQIRELISQKSKVTQKV